MFCLSVDELGGCREHVLFLHGFLEQNQVIVGLDLKYSAVMCFRNILFTYDRLCFHAMLVCQRVTNDSLMSMHKNMGLLGSKRD